MRATKSMIGAIAAKKKENVLAVSRGVLSESKRWSRHAFRRHTTS